MLTRTKVLSLLVMAALAGACSSPGASSFQLGKVGRDMLVLVESDNGRSVSVRLGEQFRLTLPENASTGYRWAIDRNDAAFMEAQAPLAQYSAPGVGAAGSVAFIFQGKKAGTGEIVLKHWREWEGDASVIARFRIQVVVQP